MKTKKTAAFMIGGAMSVGAIIGIMLLVAPKAVTVTAAVIVICLSLASGLILPNPVSFWFLLAGIGVLVLPSWIVGIYLLVLSAVGMVTVPFSYKSE